jgi:hypothetical protein
MNTKHIDTGALGATLAAQGHGQLAQDVLAQVQAQEAQRRAAQMAQQDAALARLDTSQARAPSRPRATPRHRAGHFPTRTVGMTLLVLGSVPIAAFARALTHAFASPQAFFASGDQRYFWGFAAVAYLVAWTGPMYLHARFLLRRRDSFSPDFWQSLQVGAAGVAIALAVAWLGRAELLAVLGVAPYASASGAKLLLTVSGILPCMWFANSAVRMSMDDRYTRAVIRDTTGPFKWQDPEPYEPIKNLEGLFDFDLTARVIKD